MALTRKPFKADDGGTPTAPGYMKGTRSSKAKTRTIKSKKKGQKPITFHPGGLHSSTGTPKGQKIPASKIAKALSGGFGPKAASQARFAKNVLNKGE